MMTRYENAIAIQGPVQMISVIALFVKTDIGEFMDAFNTTTWNFYYFD